MQKVCRDLRKLVSPLTYLIVQLLERIQFFVTVIKIYMNDKRLEESEEV